MFLFIGGDALFDIALQLATQVNWQLSQLKGHLVALVSLGILLDDSNDSLRLLGCKTVDLTDQIITLLYCQWLLIEVDGGLSLCRRLLATGHGSGLAGNVPTRGLRINLFGLGRRRCLFAGLLGLEQLHLLLKLLDLVLLASERLLHLSLTSAHGGCPRDADLTEYGLIREL